MGNGDSKNCSFSMPCPVCGKPDWCNIVSYPNGNYIVQCQRVHGVKGDVISAGGVTYRCSKNYETGFTAWQPLDQYNAFMEELKKSKTSGKPQRIVAQTEIRKQQFNVEGVSEILPPEKLDLFYRTLLSLLVLEDKHKAKLKDEWDETEGMFERITTLFPIKSMPPEDRIRFSSNERLNNLSRKKIMEKLIEKCGEPKGVPGMYQRKDGAWTFHPLCGIVFPVYDTMGRIIRIRINVDYPIVKGQLDGVDGKYSYFLYNDVAGWYFTKDGTNNPQLVWQYGSNSNKITLNKKGYPDGKVAGKYMNFTSCKLLDGKDENGNIVVKVNKYTNGCESGSFCSVYTKEGDDPTIVYITEGEKKAMVANQFLDVPVISVPGVNSFYKLFEKQSGMEQSIIESLKSNGTKAVAIVYDADKEENEKVLRAEQGAVKSFMDYGIRVAIGEWNPKWGKGLDDVLLSGVKPTLYFVKND